ncbi:uncharacterized protein HVO_A0343 (plasmid) [Haloferax volcanii DS2]|uniref:Uncharacterized protein n=1 Tax=Haloferax volcanii (strain ATCC 29605 / DSM 3757 / JCM 8879 / NBRC 14742 / NCIMB 2012 / VKM B-1768 / DS2) TaxID=309800 RepID=D4GR20_HALVD|nr:uncharacterized protein HVO_A0343 [Haloferax volcanii DS2]
MLLKPHSQTRDGSSAEIDGLERRTVYAPRKVARTKHRRGNRQR